MLSYRKICELAATRDNQSLLRDAGVVIDPEFWKELKKEHHPEDLENIIFAKKADNPRDSRPLLKSIVGNLPYDLAMLGIDQKSHDLAHNHGKIIKLPDQMYEVFEAISKYADDATILPAIRTPQGRVPCRNKRALITNVATVLLSEMCFYTNLVARQDKNGRYIDWAKEALARKAGFTYFDANGKEKIESSWLDSWDMFTQAYVACAQSTKMIRHAGNRKGWPRSIKAIKTTFFLHLCGSGAMQPQRLESLRQYAKEKFMSKYSNDEEIYARTQALHELSLCELVQPENVDKITAKVQKVQSKRNNLIESFTKSGFTLFTAAKLAWATIPTSFSLRQLISLSPHASIS